MFKEPGMPDMPSGGEEQEPDKSWTALLQYIQDLDIQTDEPLGSIVDLKKYLTTERLVHIYEAIQASNPGYVEDEDFKKIFKDVASSVIQEEDRAKLSPRERAEQDFVLFVEENMGVGDYLEKIYTELAKVEKNGLDRKKMIGMIKPMLVADFIARAKKIVGEPYGLFTLGNHRDFLRKKLDIPPYESQGKLDDILVKYFISLVKENLGKEYGMMQIKSTFNTLCHPTGLASQNMILHAVKEEMLYEDLKELFEGKK